MTRKIERKYTVKFNETGRKKPKSENFENLKIARAFSVDKYREGTFVSLTNIKKVALTL